MPSLKTFSLYLGKPTINNLDELLTDKAKQLIGTPALQRIPSAEFADESVAYVFLGKKSIPKWVTQLKPIFALPDNIFSRSPSAILAFKNDGAAFAITFGHAHVYLEERSTEADFGLKVAINAVSDEKLRSIERSNIGIAIRDFAQAAGQKDLGSFGIDDALDLIRKVSGRAANAGFADTVTGSRPLRFSKQIEIGDLPKIATEATTFFASTAYKGTAFKVIDFLSPVLDPDKEDKLNELLVKAIQENTDDFEIAIPEISSHALASFKFERAGIRGYYPDLSLEIYTDGIGKKLDVLSVDDLKTHAVAAYEVDGDQVVASWSVYKSLIGSLIMDDERYALNEGNWYQASQAFKKSADEKFLTLLSAVDKKLIPLKKIIEPKVKGRSPKTGFQSEESYNVEAAKASGYLLLDQKLVQIDEKPGSGIEVCDLLDVPGRRYIHIKKSSRQSSLLSHFFRQGGNSARTLKKYEPFRLATIKKIRGLYGVPKAEEFKTALEGAKPWTVEFRIADFPRRDGSYNIPFFSKLSLQEEARDLEAMGFKVKIGFIELKRVALLPGKKAK